MKTFIKWQGSKTNAAKSKILIQFVTDMLRLNNRSINAAKSKILIHFGADMLCLNNRSIMQGKVKIFFSTNIKMKSRMVKKSRRKSSTKTKRKTRRKTRRKTSYKGGAGFNDLPDEILQNIAVQCGHKQDINKRYSGICESFYVKARIIPFEKIKDLSEQEMFLMSKELCKRFNINELLMMAIRLGYVKVIDQIDLKSTSESLEDKRNEITTHKQHEEEKKDESTGEWCVIM